MNVSARPSPRKASREVRRQQLIEATISSLARRGYAQTTLTDVAAAAGVSHGLVNFHFQSKERLLGETLLFMSEEYRANWMQALALAPQQPAAQLNALILADFNEAICTPDRLAAWCAYWGEAQSRPLYQEQCGANDEEYIRIKEEICARLIADGGYGWDPARAARVVRVTVEGVWLDFVSTTAPYSREEALKTVYLCTAALFPRHFDVNGPIR
jgi:TetR/AcrR family transcriptional repressor of bet genes